ncbi:unnamed protein product [Rotaria sp. Silwood1]|nr:unnamed protein product [Rotaria sp. Silwood1]CAF1362962.1 unnamed protein product [Rotaria sp. Silwood1]CAF3555382.1 unnamed protein product [Rotaria sp. Silwood1]CAF3585047.1 unnamed protein product [Rotaria sp. Silwood1]CAF3615309.1 unnamed protein product [Rotaria sp. Silwood1]
MKQLFAHNGIDDAINNTNRALGDNTASKLSVIIYSSSDIIANDIKQIEISITKLHKLLNDIVQIKDNTLENKNSVLLINILWKEFS